MASQTISLQLPSRIIYVTGSVNQVDKTFILVDEAGTWQTQVDKVSDGRYDVEVAAYSQFGLEATTSRTLWYLDGWITPVVDRTELDVRNQTEKGYYNISDLNRVGSDVRWLTEQLALYGYPADTIPKSDWTMEDWPTESAMAQYLANVRNLVAAFLKLPTTPPLPERMAKLDWQKANAIEQNLADLKQVLEWLVACFKRSGTFYVGEGSVILPT